MIMVGLCSLSSGGGGAPRREASKNAPAMQKLPPIWLSGYPAIIFGKESEQAQEKSNEKSEADLPKKVYPAIRVFEYDPRLTPICVRAGTKNYPSVGFST